MLGGMRRALPLLALSLVACGDDESSGPTVHMAFDAPGFYDAPFPSDHRLVAGKVSLAAFPHRDSPKIVTQVMALLDGQADGFGTTSGIYFTLDVPVDPASLPDLHASVAPASSVVLLDADDTSPSYLTRYPVDARIEQQGLFGAPNLLAILPLQGIPLRPRTLHAAAITRALVAADGTPFAPSPALAALVAGERPPGLDDAAFAAYQRAIAALGAAGIPADELAGVAAFTTWDGAEGLRALAEHARTLPVPAPLEPFVQTDLFPDYCVYQSRLAMPVYQRGEPPFSDEGGDIAFEDGTPVLDHEEDARIFVTVPRAPMPAAGWPTAVMIRTGGGGDRPLVDRGVHAVAHGEAVEPGSGPARYFASVGFAGVSVDGPHGGIRNVTMGDEQLLVFNVANPAALRDNLRQSALEIALVPDVLAALSVDVADCAGTAGPATFDTTALALMGHSMGATIAPLTLAVEPRYRAAVMSGAGGSFIENVVYKLSPVAVRPLAEVLLGYPSEGLTLDEHDPFLDLLQWAGEPADPPIYAPAVGAHMLVFQGIVDTYILPPIANATNLSFRLDLAGTELDQDAPELAAFRPFAEVMPYSGAEAIALPASGNADGVTAVVVQHPEDGIEDGHEVMFQTEAPKHEYRCFLASFLEGTPTVIEGAGALDACP
jgi:hypothetical protein